MLMTKKIGKDISKVEAVNLEHANNLYKRFAYKPADGQKIMLGKNEKGETVVVMSPKKTAPKKES